ncbi:hypothetical protein VaNZ11_007787 [Volvox africanus]|uniref:Vacuolar protein sorting-associated protein 8 central domain-containing protein n=1 Tax=Volvox africanus TaxID=51714 RepID=A0ABQ5S3N1_9CHLO|nr:hypothetical protein VaNZ11_007787 [Volvox africanus]
MASRALSQAALVAGSLADALTSVAGGYAGEASGEWAALDGDAEPRDGGPQQGYNQIAAMSTSRTPTRTGTFGPPPWASPSSLPSMQPTSAGTPQPPTWSSLTGQSASTVPVSDNEPGTVNEDLFAGLEVDPHVPAFPANLAPPPPPSLPSVPETRSGPEKHLGTVDAMSAPLPTQQHVLGQPSGAAVSQGTQQQLVLLSSSLMNNKGCLLTDVTAAASASLARGSVTVLPAAGHVSTTDRGPAVDLSEFFTIALPVGDEPATGRASLLPQQLPSLGAGGTSAGCDSALRSAGVAGSFARFNDTGSAVNVPNTAPQRGMAPASGMDLLGYGMEELVRLPMSTGPAPTNTHAVTSSNMMAATPSSQPPAAGSLAVVLLSTPPVPASPGVVGHRHCVEAAGFMTGEPEVRITCAPLSPATIAVNRILSDLLTEVAESVEVSPPDLDPDSPTAERNGDVRAQQQQPAQEPAAVTLLDVGPDKLTVRDVGASEASAGLTDAAQMSSQLVKQKHEEDLAVFGEAFEGSRAGPGRAEEGNLGESGPGRTDDGDWNGANWVAAPSTVSHLAETPILGSPATAAQASLQASSAAGSAKGSGVGMPVLLSGTSAVSSSVALVHVQPTSRALALLYQEPHEGMHTAARVDVAGLELAPAASVLPVTISIAAAAEDDWGELEWIAPAASEAEDGGVAEPDTVSGTPGLCAQSAVAAASDKPEKIAEEAASSGNLALMDTSGGTEANDEWGDVDCLAAGASRSEPGSCLQERVQDQAAVVRPGLEGVIGAADLAVAVPSMGVASLSEMPGACDDGQHVQAVSKEWTDASSLNAAAEALPGPQAAGTSAGAPGKLLPTDLAAAVATAAAAAAMDPWSDCTAAQQVQDELSLLPSPMMPGSSDGGGAAPVDNLGPDADAEVEAAVLPLNIFPVAPAAPAGRVCHGGPRRTELHREAAKGRSGRGAAGAHLGPFTLLDHGEAEDVQPADAQPGSRSEMELVEANVNVNVTNPVQPGEGSERDNPTDGEAGQSGRPPGQKEPGQALPPPREEVKRQQARADAGTNADAEASSQELGAYSGVSFGSLLTSTAGPSQASEILAQEAPELTLPSALTLGTPAAGVKLVPAIFPAELGPEAAAEPMAEAAAGTSLKQLEQTAEQASVGEGGVAQELAPETMLASASARTEPSPGTGSVQVVGVEAPAVAEASSEEAVTLRAPDCPGGEAAEHASAFGAVSAAESRSTGEVPQAATRVGAAPEDIFSETPTHAAAPPTSAPKAAAWQEYHSTQQSVTVADAQPSPPGVEAKEEAQKGGDKASADGASLKPEQPPLVEHTPPHHAASAEEEVQHATEAQETIDGRGARVGESVRKSGLALAKSPPEGHPDRLGPTPEAVRGLAATETPAAVQQPDVTHLYIRESHAFGFQGSWVPGAGPPEAAQPQLEVGQPESGIAQLELELEAGKPLPTGVETEFINTGSNAQDDGETVQAYSRDAAGDMAPRVAVEGSSTDGELESPSSEPELALRPPTGREPANAPTAVSVSPGTVSADARPLAGGVANLALEATAETAAVQSAVMDAVQTAAMDAVADVDAEQTSGVSVDALLMPGPCRDSPGEPSLVTAMEWGKEGNASGAAASIAMELEVDTEMVTQVGLASDAGTAAASQRELNISADASVAGTARPWLCCVAATLPMDGPGPDEGDVPGGAADSLGESGPGPEIERVGYVVPSVTTAAITAIKMLLGGEPDPAVRDAARPSIAKRIQSEEARLTEVATVGTAESEAASAMGTTVLSGDLISALVEANSGRTTPACVAGPEVATIGGTEAAAGGTEAAETGFEVAAFSAGITESSLADASREANTGTERLASGSSANVVVSAAVYESEPASLEVMANTSHLPGPEDNHVAAANLPGQADAEGAAPVLAHTEEAAVTKPVPALGEDAAVKEPSVSSGGEAVVGGAASVPPPPGDEASPKLQEVAAVMSLATEEVVWGLPVESAVQNVPKDDVMDSLAFDAALQQPVDEATRPMWGRETATLQLLLPEGGWAADEKSTAQLGEEWPMLLPCAMGALPVAGPTQPVNLEAGVGSNPLEPAGISVTDSVNPTMVHTPEASSRSTGRLQTDVGILGEGPLEACVVRARAIVAGLQGPMDAEGAPQPQVHSLRDSPQQDGRAGGATVSEPMPPPQPSSPPPPPPPPPEQQEQFLGGNSDLTSAASEAKAAHVVAAAAVPFDLSEWLSGSDGFGTDAATAVAPPAPEAQAGSSYDAFMLFMDLDPTPSPPPPPPDPMPVAPMASLSPHGTGAFRDMQLVFGEPDPDPTTAHARVTSLGSPAASPPAAEAAVPAPEPSLQPPLHHPSAASAAALSPPVLIDAMASSSGAHADAELVLAKHSVAGTQVDGLSTEVAAAVVVRPAAVEREEEVTCHDMDDEDDDRLDLSDVLLGGTAHATPLLGPFALPLPQGTVAVVSSVAASQGTARTVTVAAAAELAAAAGDASTNLQQVGRLAPPTPPTPSQPEAVVPPAPATAAMATETAVVAGAAVSTTLETGATPVGSGNWVDGVATGGSVWDADVGGVDVGDGDELMLNSELRLPAHEVALLRAEKAEAALLAGPSNLADVLLDGDSLGSGPSPGALMLSSIHLSTTAIAPPPRGAPAPRPGTGKAQPQPQPHQAPIVSDFYAGSAVLDPLAGLTTLLADAAQDWNPSGRPDALGAMVGGSVALRLEELHTVLPDITQHWLTSGRPRVVTISNAIMAVGTSLGAALVFHLPAASGAKTAAGGEGGGSSQYQQHASQGGMGMQGAHVLTGQLHYSGSVGGGVGALSLSLPPYGQGGGGGLGPSTMGPSSGSSSRAIVVVGEPRNEAEAVTALALSTVTGPGDPLWLLVGHASGVVAAWDLQRRPPKQVAVISGQHDLPVVQVSFFPGRGASMALSADRRGNLLLHTFTHIVLKTAVASRVVLGGNMGSIGSVVHLTPFFAATSASTPAVQALVQPLAVTDTTAAGQSVPQPPAGAGGSVSTGIGAAALSPPGARVGDGMVALCATTGCHIGRFKPSGELIPLYSIPRPASVPSPLIPCAAWLPHQRRSARPPSVAVAAPDAAGGATTVVCAVLAVGWHDEVLFVDVPLVGDHNSLPSPSSPPLEASSSASSPSGAAAAPLPLLSPQTGQQRAALLSGQASQQQTGQARRSFLRAAAAFTGAARGAATAAVAAAANAAAAATAATSTALAAPANTAATLDAQTAAALAQRLPLTVTRLWNVTSAMRAAESRSRSGIGNEDVAVRVVGLHWYDSDALGVVLLLGLSMRLVVVDFELEVREQIDCIDTPYISGLMPPAPRGSAPTAPDTLAGSGARVVLLGSSSTVYCSRLLTWQERLQTLADIGKWKLGLRFALDFYKLYLARVAAAAATSAATGGPLRSLSVGVGVGGAAVDSTYPTALRGWMGSLAVGFVKSALGTALRVATAQGLTQLQLDRLPAAAVRQLREATAAAVLACLVAGHEQLLFDTVFPLCRDAGAAGPLVEAVEVAVLAGSLPRPAPELVQALVDHLAGTLSRPDRVERCVLHFDITSLDLDQVLRLCETHQLHSASAAIYSRLHDYKRPLLDMLAAAAGLEAVTATGPSDVKQHEQSPWQLALAPRHASSSDNNAMERRRRAAGFKLLVYLRCIFRRQAFPPGAGPLPDIIPGVGRHGEPGGPDDVKAQLLGLLLFLEPKDLAREWRRPLGQLPPALLAGPHPALQVLLSIDVAAAVSVLGSAVAGWDAVETDLREAAGRAAAELDSVLVATQVLVNAFIHLLECDDSGRNLEVNSAEAGYACSSATTGSEVVLDFIAGLLAAGRVVVQPNFALRLLRHVAEKAIALLQAAPAVEGEEPGMAEGRRSEQGAAVATGGPHEAAEGLFERLVTAVGVNGEGPRFDPSKLSLQETEVALDLARRASFPRALATLHHLRGDYLAALACHLNLPPDEGMEATATKDQREAAAGANGKATSAFAYVSAFLRNGSGATAAQRIAMYDALLAAAPDLVSADPQATAQLLLAYYSGEAQAAAFLERLSGDRRLQYGFLTAAIRHKEAQGGQDDGDGNIADAPYSSYSSASLQAAHAAAVAALGGWMSQPAVAHTYVELLCEFEPCAVLPFLEQHHGYDVRYCIGLCGAVEVWDAEAYLHERLGEWEVALELHLRNVERHNRELDQAVRSGAVSAFTMGTAAGTVFFDHLAWLLELSPRLALLMQGSLGRSAVEEAEQARSSRGRQQQQQQQQQEGQRGLTQPASSADPITPAGSIAAARCQQQAGQLAATGREEAAGGAPLELARAWEALGRAVAFCGRCFKQQQAQQQAQRQQRRRQQQQQQQERASQSQLDADFRASAGSAAVLGPSHCWYALLHAYVEEVQRRRPSSTGNTSGARSRRPGASGPDLTSAPSSEAGADAEAAVLAAAGDPVAEVECQERVLRHVFGVFLEEVISHMSDFVPPSEVVRHIIHTYGNQDFGGFRSTLLSLLGSCAYEQAIMSSAQRLISRGVFASHKQRLALVAGRLPQSALRTQPEAEPHALASAPAACSDLGDASAPAGTAVEMDTTATGAVDAVSPAAVAPFWRLHSKRPGGSLLHSDISRGSSGCSSGTTVVGCAQLPLVPAGYLRNIHTKGQFMAALRASGELAGATHGSGTVVSRARIQVVAGSGRRPTRSLGRPATTAGVFGASRSGAGAGAGSGSHTEAPGTAKSQVTGEERASIGLGGGGGLDVDELLNWTRAFVN